MFVRNGQKFLTQNLWRVGERRYAVEEPNPRVGTSDSAAMENGTIAVRGQDSRFHRMDRPSISPAKRRINRVLCDGRSGDKSSRGKSPA